MTWPIIRDAIERSTSRSESLRAAWFSGFGSNRAGGGAVDLGAVCCENDPAPAFLGVGLAWTLVAARRAGVVGLSIRGLGAWLSATVVVWLVTAAATVC